jgi:hypothetical protein
MSQNEQVQKYVQLAQSKINETLHKFPHVEDKVEQVAQKLKIDKAWVAVGLLAIPFFLLLVVGSGSFFV